MIKKYGKDINMRDLRSMEQEIQINKQFLENCRKYFDTADIASTTCRICGSNHTKCYFKGYQDYTYYECETCGGLFLANLPKISEMYREEQGCSAPYYIDDSSFMERVKIIAAPKVDFVMEVCRNIGVHVKKWLDIGSGGGQILHYVKQLGLEEYGIESDRSQYEYTRKRGYHVLNAFIDPETANPDIDRLVQDADVVSLITVLEHIEYPDRLTDYLKKNLKKGAVLALEVPRHPSVSSFVCMTHRNIVYRHLNLPVHLQIFNEKTLEILFGDELEIIAEWQFGQGFSDLINFPAILSDSYDQKLYAKIMEHNNEVQRIFDTSGLSDELIVIARKR